MATEENLSALTLELGRLASILCVGLLQQPSLDNSLFFWKWSWFTSFKLLCSREEILISGRQETGICSWIACVCQWW